MRYLDIETISFTDQNGKQYPIKNIRIIPTYTHLMTIKKTEKRDIDEIVSRNDIYGAESEADSYKVWDHNIEAIVEARYDLTKLSTLRIPL